MYAPVERLERRNFFNSLPRPSLPEEHLVGGHFNCALDSIADCTIPTTHVTTGSAGLIAWCATLGAHDTWRTQHHDSRAKTSPSGKTRIHYIIQSDRLSQHTRTDIKPNTAGSDHCCPATVMGSASRTTQKGHCQLPAWLIPHALPVIDHILNTFTARYTVPEQALHFSRLLRDVTTSCRATQRAATARHTNATTKSHWIWHNAHVETIINPTDENIQSAVKVWDCWKKSNKTTKKNAKAAAFDHHFSQSERCSASFLSRGKTRRRKAPIAKVRKPDNSVSSDPQHVTAQPQKFRSTTFSNNGSGTETQPTIADMQPLLDRTQALLTPQQQKSLESPFTTSKTLSAISSQPHGKRQPVRTAYEHSCLRPTLPSGQLSSPTSSNTPCSETVVSQKLSESQSSSCYTRKETPTSRQTTGLYQCKILW